MLAKLVPLDLKRDIDTLEPHTDRHTHTHTYTSQNRGKGYMSDIVQGHEALGTTCFLLSVLSFSQGCT
jgi:hypothetical protein